MVGQTHCHAGLITRRMMQMTISTMSCCNPITSEYWQPRGGHMSVVPEKALLQCICDCGERKQEVVDALNKLNKLGPARLQNNLVDWNTEHGLLLYRG